MGYRTAGSGSGDGPQQGTTTGGSRTMKHHKTGSGPSLIEDGKFKGAGPGKTGVPSGSPGPHPVTGDQPSNVQGKAQ